MRRGTQGHVAAPRRPTWHTHLLSMLYSIYIHIMGKSAFRRPEGHSTYQFFATYIPVDLPSFIPCGTKNPLFQVRSTVGSKRVTHRASIRWTQSPPQNQSCTWLKRHNYNGQIYATWRHHTLRSRGCADHPIRSTHVS